MRDRQTLEQQPMAPNQPSIPPGTPPAEFEIDQTLVFRLLVEQHPDLASLPIRPGDEGFDNAMFQLGKQWCVRLPRRSIAATLIEHEQTWLPHFAHQLPLPIPVPYRLGTPTEIYPWHWSVLPWLPGQSADLEEPHANQAIRIASFLRSLHQPAPPKAPHNPFRGVPLAQRAALIEERMMQLEQQTNLITPVIKSLWKLAINAPLDVQPTWLHGDLHARNVLAENGVITGIIDWGDLTAGDRATDLATIWMLFGDRTAREQAIAHYAPSSATLLRAKGWAIVFGALLLSTGLFDNPRHAAMGARTLQRVLEDE